MPSIMDPAPSPPTGNSDDRAPQPQQVMSPTLSVGANQQEMQASGHAVLAGEDRGPDYRAGFGAQSGQQLPNGVPPADQQQRADGPVESGSGFQSPMVGPGGDYVAEDVEAALPAYSGLGRATAPGATTHVTSSGFQRVGLAQASAAAVLQHQQPPPTTSAQQPDGQIFESPRTSAATAQQQPTSATTTIQQDLQAARQVELREDGSQLEVEGRGQLDQPQSLTIPATLRSEMQAVEEEFVMTSTTSSPERRSGRVRAQQEATWGFSRTGQAFYRRVIAPVLEQAGVVKAQAPPPRSLPQPIAKSPSMNQGAPGGPLMPPNVQQAMRAWTARPSLLTPRPPIPQRSHDAVSSSSSGHQEMVAEEVRRQVQGALQARDASMRALAAENEELKRMLVVQNQALGAVRETGRPMIGPTPLPSFQEEATGADGPDVGRVGNPGLEGLGDGGCLGGLPGNSQSGPLPGGGQAGTASDQRYPGAPEGQLGPSGSGGGNAWGLPSEGVNAPSSTGHRDGPPQPSTTEPLQLLVQGMRQLQQAYLEKKDGPEQEVIKGGIELPKLPEPHADGGVEFQDWVYMTEQMVGSLTDKAGAWYMATLVCAKEAFARYQAATPLDRLNIAPILPDQLRAKLWERLDRRVLTLVLAAMPRQAKEDAVTHRVKTTADALFRLYVLYQPGSTTERAAVLKLLEGAPAGENPEEAVTALRRWRRHLNRAVDMGITPPDASLQLRGLDLIIAKVVEQDAGLSFRLSLARHALQLQNRPTQETVLQFYDHALAEIQQLAPLKGKSQGGPRSNQAPGHLVHQLELVSQRLLLLLRRPRD